MESSDLGSEKKKKKMRKKKSKTEASDLDSERKKMKKKSKMEASDVDSEKKKKKNKKKSKAEASDLDSEKKKMKKEMRMTKASDLESEKNKKMKKSKNKNMSLAIEEYEPETDPVEMKTSLESSSVDLEAEKAKMNLETKTSQEEEENKAIHDEEEPDLSSYSTASESDDEVLTASDMVKYREYCAQMVSSGGFDIDHCPPLFQCKLIPVNPSLKKGDKEYDKLCRFSKLAINQYNSDYDTNYEFVKYVKAVSAMCAGEKYYITFEAKEPSSDDAPTTFQGLVYEGIPERRGTEIIEELKVLLVRKKSFATQKDNNILLC